MRKNRTIKIWTLFLMVSLCACLPEKRTSQIKPLDLAPIIEALTASAPAPTATETLIPIDSKAPEATPAAGTIPLPTHPAFKLDAIPTLRAEPSIYEVASGDTLSKIASAWQVSQKAIIQQNNIKNPDLISVGQVFTIPAQIPDFTDSSPLTIPDEALIYGKTAGEFDVAAFLAQSPKSYLANYLEPTPTPASDNEDAETPIAEGAPRFIPRTAAQIIEQTAIENSINPKILIALMQFQSQSYTLRKPNEYQKGNEIVALGAYYRTLSRQLNWAADTLNNGYYRWKNNRINQWILDDDTVVAVNKDINPATAAIQYLFSKIYGKEDWVYAVSQNGFLFTYKTLFGDPGADFFRENAEIDFPQINLPFSSGETWSFTSGPHFGWSNGTPWAALDFAPQDTFGCQKSIAWVKAVHDGTILYAQDGLVIEDSDGDGNIGTGWVYIYLHIAKEDRVFVGDEVKRGDRIGHPSCEGGISTGTHLHFARRYNGEWIPISSDFPLILSGWEAFSTGTVYDGYLVKDGKIVEAFYFKTKESDIAY